MENQIQLGKICTSVIYHSQKNVPTSNPKQKIPQAEDVKYLGLHFDRKLNWRKHITTKRKQFGIKLSKMYWLLRQQAASIKNKLLL